MTVDIYGFAFNLAGTAVDGATAQMFTRNTASQVGSDYVTGTASDGEFTWSGVAEGRYDIKVTSGSSVRWRKYDDEIQVAMMEAAVLKLRGTNYAFTHVFQGTPTATRTITFQDSSDTVVGRDTTDTLTSKTLTSPVFNTGVSGTAISTDTALGTSNTLLSSQGAIKSYVDTKVATADTLSEVLALGNTSGSTSLVINSGQVLTTNTINETTATSGVTIDSVLLKDNTVTATTFVGALTGNADTATKTATPRAINGVNFDGSAAITVTAAAGTLTGTTLKAEVVTSSLTTVGALGAGSIGTGFGVINNAAAITGTVLTATTNFTMGSTVVTDGVITDASGLSLAADVTVTGDLTVSGTTTTVNSTTVAIADSLLLLAKDQGTSSDAVDFGLYGKYGVGGTAKYAGIFRDGSVTGDPWTFFDGNQVEPGTTVNTGGTGYALAPISAATGSTIGNLTLANGSITDSSGAITFVDENLSTTGTLAAGATTLSGDTTITNGNGLVVGHTAKITAAGEVAELQMVGSNASGGDYKFGIYSFGANGVGALIDTVQSRSTDFGATPAIVQDGDNLFRLRVLADDGVDIATVVGQIAFEVNDASPVQNFIGTDFIIKTMPEGGGIAEALRLDSSQNATFAGSISIPATDKLYLDGGGDTYIYQESLDDLHIVVGNSAYIQIDQDMNAMSIGIAAPVDGNTHMLLGGAFTSSGSSTAAQHGLFYGTLTGAAGDTTRLNNVSFDGSIVTQTATENIAYVSQLFINEPNITKNLTGSIAVAATVYIADAPTEGTQNYALHIASGAVGVAGSAGTDGQVLTSGGANANAAWEDAAAGGGGITAASIWRLSADLSSSSGSYTTITANWEEMDDASFTRVGSVMSQSSGVFTFPATGIWRVKSALVARSVSNSTGVFLSYIATTENGTAGTPDWEIPARGEHSILAAAEGSTQPPCETVFEVTAVNTHQVKFSFIQKTGATVTIAGDTDFSESYIYFEKLADL